MRGAVLTIAVLGVGFLGCTNGQPTTYSTAISLFPTTALPATCYTNGVLPTTTTTSTNQNTEADWTLWTGTSNQQFLNPGPAFDFTLGNSPPIRFDDVTIEGGPTVFTESQVLTSATTTTTQTVTVTFSATPSDTVSGTIDANSQDSCATCISCEATFSFVGRKVF